MVRAKDTYKIGGQAPQGHARQCQGKSTRTRLQCRRWALKEQKFCARHGGRQTHVARINLLPRLYGKLLGGTMEETMNALLDESPAEQIQLFEELALTRVVCRDAVKLFAAAQQGDDEQKILAQQVMLDALKFVKDMCEGAAKVDNNSKDKFSIQHVRHISNQITQCAHEAFGMGDPDAVKRFAELIKAKVKMPSASNDGTDITPDQDVLEMDATIPRQEDE